MWLLELLILWISIDIIVCATYWFIVNAIKPLCSDWWNRNIALEVDPYFDLEPALEIRESDLEPLHTLQQ